MLAPLGPAERPQIMEPTAPPVTPPDLVPEAGWIEALTENAPGTFVSIPVSEKEPFLGSV